MSRDLFLDLNLKRGRLRSSLREAIRAAIQDGRLAPAAPLPSSRQLAADLGVSRGVVSDTYDQLHAEGYLEILPRSAPIVADLPGVSAPEAVESLEPRHWRFDLLATSPDLDAFPARTWVRAIERALQEAPIDALDYGDHRGRPEVRAALADYLARVRGVRIRADRMVITQGFSQGLDLLCRVLVQRGARGIAVETPSLPDVWYTAERAGLSVVGLPVDREGLIVTGLEGLDIGAIVVSPAHQFPTGAVLASQRRSELLAWAANKNAIILEDDYDAEFRYDREPVGSIQGLDPEHVAHMGTASKTLAPAIRLGWLSLPRAWIDDVVAAKRSADSGSPAIDQLAFADLLVRGDYERHIGRLRREYRQRRHRLLLAVRTRLPGAEILGAAAGLHVVLRLPNEVDDIAIEREASHVGMRIQALSTFHLMPSPMRGLLLGYGHLHDSAIELAIATLASILGDLKVPLGRRDPERVELIRS